MSDTEAVDITPRSYWPTGMMAKLISGLTGILAVLVAIKAAAYTGSETPMFENQDHFFRVLAFAALTIWVTFTLGAKRRGEAAIIALAFACFVELVIVPARGESLGTLVSANLGIVFAYCSIHLYWLGLADSKETE